MKHKMTYSKTEDPSLIRQNCDLPCSIESVWRHQHNHHICHTAYSSNDREIPQDTLFPIYSDVRRESDLRKLGQYET